MHHPLRKDKTCLNCGHIVEGRYCTNCGQENIEPREKFSELAGHFIADLLHFDTQFFSTIRYLLFKPGYLTQEYMKGRRKAYLHPIRMYLFVSILYFFLASVVPLHREAHLAFEYRNKEQLTTHSTNLLPYTTIQEYDSVQAHAPVKNRDPHIIQLFMHRLIQLQAQYGNQTAEILRERILHHVPQVMFFLLPLFALLLELHFSKRKFYFSDHIIFSLHFHIFYFVVSGIELVLQYVFYTDFFSWASLIVWIYLVLAMRRVYQNKWLVTILKSFSITLLYSIMIGIVMAGLFAWILMID